MPDTKETTNSSALSSSKSSVSEAFRLFDRNNDGVVTEQEVRDLVKALGGDPQSPSAQPLLLEAKNGLELDSFVSLWQTLRASDEEDEIVEAFKEYDRNNDGYITIDEMTEVMKNMGFVADKEQEALKCLKEMDVDGDDRVSYTEFLLKWKMS